MILLFSCKNQNIRINLSYSVKEIDLGKEYIVTLKSGNITHAFKLKDFDSLYLLTNYRKDSLRERDNLIHCGYYQGSCKINYFISSDTFFQSSIKKSKDIEHINIFLKEANVTWKNYEANKGYYDSFVISSCLRNKFTIINNIILSNLSSEADSFLMNISGYKKSNNMIGYCFILSYRESVNKLKLSSDYLSILYGAGFHSTFYYFLPKETKDGYLSYSKIILNPIIANDNIHVF